MRSPEIEDHASEQARLAEQLITAEQDERRRLALFLHDGPVQSLSGIALMLDAVRQAIDEGRLDDANRILGSALERHRDTIRSLRDLSFNLEPVILRDHGFGAAVQGLAERLGISEEIQIDLDIELGESLSEQAQVALYQIVREALNQAVRRGPPTRISIAIEPVEGGGIATVISDDGHGERRRASVEEIESRARPLHGTVSVERREDGTIVRIELPAYTAQR